ncbi:MAG TPA: hypothetical protein DFS52_32480, partial [Myxococcales bacterium]|nr:hypothetical protein [Myxococcales bacterium]
GATVDVPGGWICTDVEPAQRSPETCATSPELCQALFTPEEGFLFEWSSNVSLVLGGGLYEPGVAPEQLTSVESARATTRGGQLPAELALDFHVIDPPALAVLAASPAHGSTGVERSPAITLAFSEPPDCSALNDATIALLSAVFDPHPRVAATDGPVAGQWTCPAPRQDAPYACAAGEADDPCVVTFQPDSALPFEWSTNVSLLIQGGAFDAAARVLESTRATSLGGQLPTDFSAQWRVVDPPPLALVAVSPADGATGVERSPALRFTFSEP